MDDALLARWPRPVDDAPVPRETRLRDAATSAAIEAYLAVARQLPTRSEIRL